ncbi:MAG: hemerythrin domain-containing protein [Alphaproteobacteria bacterium]|nr:hemerythrin domain-containing protein [Alphaproteobacteria bacterium]
MASRNLKSTKHKSTSGPDAIAMLKADHRKVESLFKAFEKAKAKDPTRKQKIAEDVCMELSIHALLEEEMFYPLFRGEVDDKLLDEAYVEHDSAKVMIAEIMAASPQDDFYDAKVTVLSEEIKHHVKEEERAIKGIFAQAKRSDVDMNELGQRMAERKKELKMRFTSEGLPPPETRTLSGAKLCYGQPLAA